MKLIYICSPYRGDILKNTELTKQYCRYASHQKVIPIAPHLHNTQFLNDDIPGERKTGMELGLNLLDRCDELWVFGSEITEGMAAEIRRAKELGIPIRYHNQKCERRDEV